MDLLSRRTIREYTDEVIPKEQIEEILKVALFSPSSRNKKPLEFILINDKNILKELASCKKVVQNMPIESNFSILVLGDKSKSETWIENSSVALTLMQIKAWELEIGSCWMQIRGRINKEGKDSEQVVREILNIPDNFGVLALMTFGKFQNKPEGYQNEKINFEKIHINKF